MKYKEARPRILTGDVILWKGKGIISSLIMKWSEYSHASLVVRLKEYEELKNRVFLVEALSSGLQFRLLSEKLGKGSEAFWMSINMPLEQLEKSREHALIECAKGIPYDYSSIFKNIFGKVNNNAKEYFCSEFVWMNWISAEYISTKQSKLKAPRPGDLPVYVDVKPVPIEI
jgi:hypothetical protein